MGISECHPTMAAVDPFRPGRIHHITRRRALPAAPASRDSSRASTPMDSLQLLGVSQQLGEIVERIGTVQFAGVDQLTGQGRDDRQSSNWCGDSIFFSRRRFRKETKAPLRVGSRLGPRPGRSLLATTILFIPLPSAQHNRESDWAAAPRKYSFASVQFVLAIRSSAMAVGGNKLMTNTMTGSEFGGGSAVFAARRLPSCPCSLFLTLTTASSLAVRRCGATLWMAVPGKRPRRPSKILIA